MEYSGAGGTDSWKKPEAKNLATLSLLCVQPVVQFLALKQGMQVTQPGYQILFSISKNKMLMLKNPLAFLLSCSRTSSSLVLAK